MSISILVAVSENNVIGRDNRLPWRLSSDLRRFKTLTMRHCVIMGRKTWESIGRALPDRTSIVVSRDPNFQAAGALVANSLDAALRLAQGHREVFLIGGEEIFRRGLEFADRLYLTRVHATVEGDAYFPQFAQEPKSLKDQAPYWRLVFDERHAADAKNDHDFSFQIFERVP